MRVPHENEGMRVGGKRVHVCLCVCMFKLIVSVDEQIISVVPSHLIVEI